MRAITAICIARASVLPCPAVPRIGEPVRDINAPVVEPGDTPLGSKPGVIGSVARRRSASIRRCWSWPLITGSSRARWQSLAATKKGAWSEQYDFAATDFFAARAFKDINDLNAQATAWCQQEAALRGCPEDRDRTVQAVFEEERPLLLSLPDNPFPTEERLDAIARKAPYLRFDLNDYSIPHTHVGRPLEIIATLERVRIVEGLETIADHPRCFGRGEPIEVPGHIDDLVAHKRAGREHRALDRLHHAAPGSKKFYKLAAEHGVHLGVLTRGLLQILDTHGADALAQAIDAALGENAAHLSAVRHFIDAHLALRGERPPIAVTLPNDPRLHVTVRAHDLRDYEQLTTEPTDGHKPAERTTEP
jgi:hypothetical protein